MPVEIVAPTIVRMTMQHMLNGGRPADCISDVSLDEGPASRIDSINELVPATVTAWQQKIIAGLGSQVTFTGCRWIDLDSLGGQSGFVGPQSGQPTVGGLGGAQLAPQVAALVHKNCVHSRSQRAGRWYLPGLAESDTDDSGNLVSVALTRIGNITHDYRAQVNALGGPFIATVAMRVVHKTGPSSWNSTDIDSFSVDSKVATQRRRVRK